MAQAQAQESGETEKRKNQKRRNEKRGWEITLKSAGGEIRLGSAG